MNYRFTDSISGLNPSAIREILKYTAGNPNIIPLSAGNPSPEAFPYDEIRKIANDIFTEDPIASLQYSITEGYMPLRTHIKKYMKEKYNIGNDNDIVVVTAGAQQAIELMCKILCEKGDVVICESPSFIGSLNSFRSLGARLEGVPMEEDGMNTDILEKKLQENPNTKMIYTITNFQNPSGITMGLEKRKKLLELAHKYDVVIVEDNPYGDLRYEGKDIPSIKSMDTEGRVVYVGSFSKVMAPGLRVGYAIGYAELLQKAVVAKQGEDVHTSAFPQILCYKYMTEYDFEAHLDYLRDLYSKKEKVMRDMIEKELVPYGVYCPKIEGGLFMWCVLPEKIQMKEFCTRAVKEYNVAVVPGNAFSVNEDDKCNAFRVNFSTPTTESMIKGIEELGKLIREYK